MLDGSARHWRTTRGPEAPRYAREGEGEGGIYVRPCVPVLSRPPRTDTQTSLPLAALARLTVAEACPDSAAATGLVAEVSHYLLTHRRPRHKGMGSEIKCCNLPSCGRTPPAEAMLRRGDYDFATVLLAFIALRFGPWGSKTLDRSASCFPLADWALRRVPRAYRCCSSALPLAGKCLTTL